MSPEFYAIIGVAIALATLILNGQRSLMRALVDLRRDVDAQGREIAALREQMHQNKTELLEQMHRNKTEILEQMHRSYAALGECMARVEALLGGPLVEISASSGQGV